MTDHHEIAQPAGGEMIESNKCWGKKSAGLNGNGAERQTGVKERSEGERKERKTDGRDRHYSPIILLIPEIRFWVSILSQITGSLFLSDRDGPRRYIRRKCFLPEPAFIFLPPLSGDFPPVPSSLLAQLPPQPPIPSSDGYFHSSPLCSSSAGKLQVNVTRSERAGLGKSHRPPWSSWKLRSLWHDEISPDFFLFFLMSLVKH